MAARQVTIGIDIGTTSVKAVAADAEGRVVATRRIPHPLITPSPGVFAHDAAVAWHHGVRRAAEEVAAEVAAAGMSVAALQVAAMVPSLCAVDDTGMPISEGLLYGDVRAGEPATRGLAPSEDGELVRMLGWLAGEHPEAAGYWPAQAVANRALCGVGAIDPVTAITTMPLFDFTGWDPAVCAEVGVDPDRLPQIVPGDGVVGPVADDLGADLAGAVVGPGTIDAFGEQLVAGADHDGDVLVVVGATLITWAVLAEWHEAPGLWSVPHTAPGKVLIGGPSNAGGIARDWAAKVLVAEPDADGVGGGGAGTLDPAEVPVFMPYVRGERVPLHDPTRRAGFDGLSVAQEPAAMWRAVHEASGFTVRRILELAGLVDPGARVPVRAAAPGGARARRIVATGGGSADPGWMQALADATGLPVHCVAEPKGAALGAAWLARGTAGLVAVGEDASQWAREGRRHEPDPGWAAHCTQRYRRFVELAGPPHDRAVESAAAGSSAAGAPAS